MQNACQPLYAEGRNITCRVGATAVIGKRAVVISANGTEGLPTVVHATALGKIFGVAGYDQVVGAAVPVIRKGVVPILTSGAITFNDEVEVGANGTVVTKTTGISIGVALFSAANGAAAFISLHE